MAAYFSARPSKGRLVKGFGPQIPPTPTSPKFHFGHDYGWIDSSTPGVGDPVYAARTGTVLSVAPFGAYGVRVVIQHSATLQTWSCHLARVTVIVGQSVSAGEQIGNEGASGNVTAKHLHFEVRVNGVAVDPAPYFTDTAGSGGTTPIGGTEMAVYELVQTPDGTVWWCVDRITRYGIPSVDALKSYQYLMQTRLGIPNPVIISQGNADAFGTPVLKNGAPATNIPASTPIAFTQEMIDQVSAEVSAKVEQELQDEFQELLDKIGEPGNGGLADAQVERILAAVNQVDENTLATFGLKRA